jgi:ABC-2 type transport system ATP-binding protein
MNGEIAIDDLSKTYYTKQRRGLFKAHRREVHALKGVSLRVRPGELFGLLGPNGAGKTTLIKILTTLLLPTAGTARINGHELGREDNAIRGSVGCMLMGERGLYWKLTGRENLRFFAALYHYTPAERERRTAAIIKKLGLGEIADRPVETYSSGQKMKLAFGKALLNDAPILILDEPTNTLDVPSAHELRDVVRELNDQGKTVVYTTHIMSEAETLCDRVAIVDQGTIIDVDTVPALKRSLGRDGVIRLEGVIPGRARDAAGQLEGVRQTALVPVNGHMQLTVVTTDRETLLPRLIETMTREGAALQRIAPEEVTLEDVFVAKTGRSLTQDTTLI